ncbi:MAG: hypothetical protein ACR2NZ_05840 [Rubripirellula sp.]
MQLKSLIRYPFDIHRARRLLADRPPAERQWQQRPIALDLRTPQLLFDCGRHLASLSHYAKQAGSSFHVRSGTMMLAAMSRKIHGGEMLADPECQWLPDSDPLPAHAMVLCDYAPSASRQDDRQYLQMLIGSEIDRGLPVMPYPMHPATLRESERTDFAALRIRDDRYGIFFAGNQKPRYGDIKMQRNFGVLSRLELISTLQTHFPSQISPTLDQASPAQSIVLSDSRVNPIKASDWLPSLSRAEFFLCCPGSSQPTCHNLVEAMSVGTIPLIEYGNRVTPELRDGVNAICFEGRNGLIDAVNRINQMTAAERRRIRNNVTTFFDEYLCGEKFMGELRDGAIDITAGRICMPFHESNFYSATATAAA